MDSNTTDKSFIPAFVSDKFEAIGDYVNRLINDDAVDNNLIPKLVAQKINDESVTDEPMETFIATLLEDENVNNSLIPDMIEKRMYAKAARPVVHMVKNFIRNVSVNVMGYKVTLIMEDETDDDPSQGDPFNIIINFIQSIKVNFMGYRVRPVVSLA